MPPVSAINQGVSVSRVITKEELCMAETVPQSCGIVIFGASGDLTHRKLLPSLFTLTLENLMPKQFYILGVGRTPLADADFQSKAMQSLGSMGSAAARQEFIRHCGYVAGDYADPRMYEALNQRLNGLDQVYETQGRHIFYLSTPPAVYETIVEQLGKRGFVDSRKPEGWVRIVVEKPFGRDLASAEQLNSALNKVFREKQIYRIDHYLGKETVQNILMFRFANAIFEPIWNQKYIDHVQITAAEASGVEHRAGYYEESGALRDMFQNHLFQLMSLIAM